MQTERVFSIVSLEEVDGTLVRTTDWTGLSMNGVNVEVSGPRDISNIITSHYLHVITGALNKHNRALGSKKITISAGITSIGPLTPIKSPSVAVNTENSIWDSSVLFRYINSINKTVESVGQINIWLWNNLQDVRTNVTAQCNCQGVLDVCVEFFSVCNVKYHYYV